MKRIFFIGLCLIAPFVATAQIQMRQSAQPYVQDNKKKEEKKVPNWKKAPEPPNATVTAAWAPIEVEHYIGIRGGYGMGTGRFEPVRQMSSYMGMLNFGVSYKIDIPKQRFVGAIEFDLEFLQRGYKYETYFESGEFKQRKYSTITLPILWQPYLPFTKTGESRLYLNAGPNLGYAFESTTEETVKKDGTIVNQGKWEYDMLRDNRFEFGIVAGAGVVVAIKRKFLIGVDFRYYIMLSDTFKGVNKYAGNPFRSPVDVMNISFKMEYRFVGKKKNKSNLK